MALAYVMVSFVTCLSFALAQQGWNAAVGHDMSGAMGDEVSRNAVRVNKIMGRKMITRLELMKGYHATGGMSKGVSDQSSFVNSDKRGKKTLHIGRKYKVNPFPDREVDDRGFADFNADYYAPRHHTPKHN